MQIKKIAVLGSGVMGSSIAQLIAESGFEVTIWSRKGNDGLGRLHSGVQKAIAKNVLTKEQATSLLSRINCTCSVNDAVKEADLVIEAVIEDLEVKAQIFREADLYCAPHTIIASNTSSLSISYLAASTKRDVKVAGMHFFNPPYAMKLVEIVQTRKTSEETMDSLVSFSKEIGKAPLVVKDTPGFVVNRILMPAINSAAFVYTENIASAEIIDNAMKLGANYPMGPLALADLIGIDTCLKIMTEFCQKLEHADYQICPIFAQMVAKGKLGRKTGKGFFEYSNVK